MATSRGTVLVIEDDAAIRRGIVDALRSEGYATLEAGDGKIGLALAVEGEWDLLLLDLVLPGVPAPGKRAGDGLDILRAVRDARPTLPVIVLTALGSESDRVKGLRLGADDYVVKPFSLTELLARVAAVLRRSPARPTDVEHIPFRGGVIDLAKSHVRFEGGETATLSQREAELLRYLAAHADRVISREEILQHVWRLDPTGVDTRTIDMHVARLREKLRDDPASPGVLLTVRGRGYRLVGEGAL
ncbi:MAG: response regulator transcription factor [Planctomycetes bacterium]|nr:response regulator transcription factor [Planctomycetota bacterium]